MSSERAGDERDHPFDEESIIYASEALAPTDEIHRALSALDREMDWVRRDVERLARSGLEDHELVGTTEGVEIYRTTESKWREIEESLRESTSVDERFSNRTLEAVQLVHKRFADSTTGGFSDGKALVLSEEE